MSDRADKPSLSVKNNTPGQEAHTRLAEILRVDHAGEYGAVRIYEGQLAVLRNRPGTDRSVDIIEHMAAQEEEHLDRFNGLINEHRVRPTALTPIWHVAGFALGAATALMGEKAAMACTAAVEEVIDEHYAEQTEALKALGEDDLCQTIEQYRADEIAHKETALAEGAEEAPAYPVLSNAIKAACRVAIAVSEKI